MTAGSCSVAGGSGKLGTNPWKQLPGHFPRRCWICWLRSADACSPSGHVALANGVLGLSIIQGFKGKPVSTVDLGAY